MSKRNYCMDVIRFAAALLVVVCHVEFLIEAPQAYYLFLGRYVPRIAVSFFFAMSGYFYLQALENGKSVFRKQLKSLLKVYLFWTVIYYSASFVLNVIIEGKDLGRFLLERVVFFFTRGSYSHFWFFPALIYSVIMATIFHRISKKNGLKVLTIVSLVLFLFGNLGSGYYEIGMKIPVVSTIISQYRDSYEVFRGIFCMGLPYFMIGYILNKCEGWIERTEQKKVLFIAVFVTLLFFIETIILITVLEWHQYPEVYLGLYTAALAIMMYLIKCPKPEWKPYANTCRRMSGYIYYVHPLIILGVKMIADMFGIYVPSVLLYVIVISVCLITGWILIKLNEKCKWISLLL